MATSNLCKGDQCPVKKQCHRFRLWAQAVCDGDLHPHCISKCPDGKWFTRDERAEHPQHRH